MGFKHVDRVRLMEMGFWPETLERWHHEGLPKWVTHDRHIEAYLGLGLRFNRNWLEIHDGVYPAYEPVRADENETHEIIRDDLGVLLCQQKHLLSIPEYIEFPVQSEDDNDRILSLLCGSDPGRYPEDFDEDLKRRVVRGEIVGLNLRSVFGFPRSLMGLTGWCVALYDQPHVIRRMISDELRSPRRCDHDCWPVLVEGHSRRSHYDRRTPPIRPCSRS